MNNLKIGDYVMTKANPTHIGVVVNRDERLVLVNPVIKYPPFEFSGTYNAIRAVDELVRVSEEAKELIKLLYE